MTKAELVAAICENLEKKNRLLNRAEVEDVLNSFYEVAGEELARDGEVSLSWMGKLKVRSTAARKGRNPRTGEELSIPERKKVVFTCGKVFREKLGG